MPRSKNSKLTEYRKKFYTIDEFVAKSGWSKSSIYGFESGTRKATPELFQVYKVLLDLAPEDCLKLIPNTGVNIMERQVVHKYRLGTPSNPAGYGDNYIGMPAGAELLHADSQDDYLHVWARVAPTAPLVARTIRVINTGDDTLDARGEYVGTVVYNTHKVSSRYVVHVFDLGVKVIPEQVQQWRARSTTQNSTRKVGASGETWVMYM